MLVPFYTYIIPTEIGEYSVFVGTDLTPFKAIEIILDSKPKIQACDFIATENGSVLYFKDTITNLLIPGHLYLGFGYREFKYSFEAKYDSHADSRVK